MTVHVCVRPVNDVERVEIGVEHALETFTPQPCAASSRGR
jgi:hypothetical protein